MSTIGPDRSAVHSGGGWNSGPMISGSPPAKDARPEYSPASLILDVRAALERAGIEAVPVPGQAHQLTTAAANLLRALGVRPTKAPER